MRQIDTSFSFELSAILKLKKKKNVYFHTNRALLFAPHTIHAPNDFLWYLNIRKAKGFHIVRCILKATVEYSVLITFGTCCLGYFFSNMSKSKLRRSGVSIRGELFDWVKRINK